MPDVLLLAAGSREAEDHAGGAHPAGRSRVRATPCRRGRSTKQEPPERDEDRQGLDGDAHRLDAGSRRCRCPTWSARTSKRRSRSSPAPGCSRRSAHLLGQAADTVTAQQPHAGDSVIKGTVVHINVSRGAKPVPVPDVTGQPYANAKSMLEGKGFQVEPHRRPVRPAEGRRRRRDAVGGHRRPGRHEDHALGLEGAGDDAGARRDRDEPVGGRVAPHRRGPTRHRSSPIRSPIRRRTASSSPPIRRRARTRSRVRS